MNEDGTMARVPQLAEFCHRHGLKLLTVAEVIRYRMRNERYVRRVAETVLPTRYGDFRMIAFASDVDSEQHIALVRGTLPARLRSCAYIPTASPAMYSGPPIAIATTSSKLARSHRGRKSRSVRYLHHTGRGFGIDSTAPTPGALPHILYHSRSQLDRDAARQRLLQHESGIGAQILIDSG